MFDLDNQVQSWRRRLLDNEAMSVEEANELENHLRETIDELCKSLSQEEAFWLAVRRTGSPETVALEFSKINGARTWTRRFQWMLAGYLLIGALLSVVGSIGSIATLSAVYVGLPAWAVFSSSGIGVTLVTLTLVLLAWSVTNGRSLGMQKLITSFSSWAKPGRRWRLALAAILLILIKFGIQVGPYFTASQHLSTAQFGAAAAVTTLTSIAGWLLIVGTIVAILCWLVSRDGQLTSNRWSSSKMITVSTAIAVALLISFGLMSFGLEAIYGPQIAAALAG